MTHEMHSVPLDDALDHDALPAWRARLKRWTTPPRRLTFTRAGKFFMLLTIAVGAGALNTGNNLLFLLLGLMLSAIVASGVLSEAIIRKLSVRRRPPRRLFAGRVALGSFAITNPRSYLSLNIEASEQNARCVRGPRHGQWIGDRGIKWWKFWKPDAFDDAHFVAIGRAFEVPARAERSVEASWCFPARGRYHSRGLRLATRFPFGLFHKVSDVPDPHEFVVYPAPARADDWVAAVAARFGDVARNRAGMGAEYFGLRDWREGEDRRRVHWRSSAKRGRVVVREHEEQEQRAVEILILHASGTHGTPHDALAARFEAALERAVWVLQSLTERRYRLAVRTLEDATVAASGPMHLDTLCALLADIPWREGSAPLAATRTLGGPRRSVARVAIGTHAALSALSEPIDLALSIDDIPSREDAPR